MPLQPSRYFRLGSKERSVENITQCHMETFGTIGCKIGHEDPLGGDIKTPNKSSRHKRKKVVKLKARKGLFLPNSHLGSRGKNLQATGCDLGGKKSQVLSLNLESSI